MVYFDTQSDFGNMISYLNMKPFWNVILKLLNTPIKRYGIDGKEIIDNSPRVSMLKGVIIILCGAVLITVILIFVFGYFSKVQLVTSQSLPIQEVEADKSSTTDTDDSLPKSDYESTNTTPETQSFVVDSIVQSSETWVNYLGVGFKVSFPEDPQITRVLGDFPSVTYRGGQKDGTQYFLTSTKFPNDYDMSDPLDLLSKAVMMSVNNLNGNLIGAIDTKNLTGHDSVDFVIGISDGPRTYMGRNVLIKDTLYEMRAVYMDYNEQDAEYRKFVDSFILQ